MSSVTCTCAVRLQLPEKLDAADAATADDGDVDGSDDDDDDVFRCGK